MGKTVMSFEVTHEEKHAVRMAAAKLNMSISAYIRMKLGLTKDQEVTNGKAPKNL